MSEVVESLKAALADRYTVERELGRGGMAVVYLAEDLRHGRKVAIKVLRPELVSAVAAERFLREIKLTASLAHPHILPVHDSGEAGGFLYYVMPYVEGESLRNRLDREKQLPVDEALRIAREVADALRYAHERDLLHRDIKPENILLEAGHAVVADFGLVKALSDAAGDRLTDTGVSVGTPAYMSPEQAAGEREIGGVSDLYSLACVLYEMLTGEPPITDPSVQKVVSRKMLGDFQPVRGVRREVTSDVDAAVSRALAAEPADRFATAGAFARALEPVSEPVGWRVRLTRVIGLLAATSVAAFVVAIAVWGIVARGWLGLADRGALADERRSIAVLPLENLSPDPANEYFAAGIHEDILSQLQKILALKVISRTSVLRYADTDKDIPTIADELGVEGVLVGSLRREGNQIRVVVRLVDRADGYLWSETYDRDLTVAGVFAIQSDIANHIAQALRAGITPEERQRIEPSPTDNLEAYEFYLRGKEFYRRSGWLVENFRSARRMFEQAVQLDPDFALAHAFLSRAHSAIYWFSHDYTDDRRLAMRVSAERALELDPTLPDAHLALGAYYFQGLRDYDRALEALSRAEELRPGDADIQLFIGSIYRRQGRWEEAIASFKQAAALDPRSAERFQELGLTYQQLRLYDEAEGYYEHALALEPEYWQAALRRATVILLRDGNLEPLRVLLSLHPERYLDRRWLEFLRRDFAAALEALSRVEEEVISSTRVYYPKSLYAGLIHCAAGQQALARAAFDTARMVLEVAVSDRPADERRHRALGLAYAGLGFKEAAVREGRTAVELLPLSVDARWGTDLQIALAQIYAMVGEYDLAIDQLDYLLSIPSDVSVPLLRVDPTWDALRNHPRFQALLERYE